MRIKKTLKWIYSGIMKTKFKTLITLVLSTSLFGQQIFLECENLYLFKSNTKWINNECVRVTPKIFDYYEIDEDKGSVVLYEWDIALGRGETSRKNEDGALQFCGQTFKFGQELIDELINSNSTWFLYKDIYNEYRGSADTYPTYIYLRFINRFDEVYMTMNLDRITGKMTDRSGHSHNCRKIKQTEFKSVLNKMKSDNAKVETALNKHFEKERKF